MLSLGSVAFDEDGTEIAAFSANLEALDEAEDAREQGELFFAIRKALGERAQRA